jgi:hypothetical protein
MTIAADLLQCHVELGSMTRPPRLDQRRCYVGSRRGVNGRAPTCQRFSERYAAVSKSTKPGYDATSWNGMICDAQ